MGVVLLLLAFGTDAVFGNAAGSGQGKKIICLLASKLRNKKYTMPFFHKSDDYMINWIATYKF